MRQHLPPKRQGIGFTLFRLNDTSDVVPTFKPAAFMSVCSKRPWSIRLRAFWLEPVSVFGSLEVTVPMAVHFCQTYHSAWTSHRLDAGSDRVRLTAFFLVRRQRYVVSTAFDPAVTSYVDVDRLMRTEPQVQFTPFVLNDHSCDFKSHRGSFPQVPSHISAGLCHLDPHYFMDDVAEFCKGEGENDPRDAEEIMATTLTDLADDRLTGFATRLAFIA